MFALYLRTSTRLGNNHKLSNNPTRSNEVSYFYFNRVVRSGNISPKTSTQRNYVPIMSYVPVQIVSSI